MAFYMYQCQGQSPYCPSPCINWFSKMISKSQMIMIHFITTVIFRMSKFQNFRRNQHHGQWHFTCINTRDNNSPVPSQYYKSKVVSRSQIKAWKKFKTTEIFSLSKLKEFRCYQPHGQWHFTCIKVRDNHPSASSPYIKWFPNLVSNMIHFITIEIFSLSKVTNSDAISFTENGTLHESMLRTNTLLHLPNL